MSWRAPFLVLLALALVAAGYIYLPHIGWSDSQADARERTAAYLDAVVGGADDRGWSLLEPSGRSQYASEDAYFRVMAEADWSRFTWEFGDSAPCDDGICTLTLRLPGGRESAPEVAWSDGPGDPGVFVSIEDRPGDADGFIEVRQRGWFGGIGIEVFGVMSH
jgi:hypothetical protein